MLNSAVPTQFSERTIANPAAQRTFDAAGNRTALAQWTARYRELIAAHENCWIVEVWAHL